MIDETFLRGGMTAVTCHKRQIATCTSVIDTVLDKTFTETPSVSKPSMLRVFAHRCSEHACLVQLGRKSDLIRWRLALLSQSHIRTCSLSVWSSTGVSR